MNLLYFVDTGVAIVQVIDEIVRAKVAGIVIIGIEVITSNEDIYLVNYIHYW